LLHIRACACGKNWCVLSTCQIDTQVKTDQSGKLINANLVNILNMTRGRISPPSGELRDNKQLTCCDHPKAAQEKDGVTISDAAFGKRTDTNAIRRKKKFFKGQELKPHQRKHAPSIGARLTASNWHSACTN